MKLVKNSLVFHIRRNIKLKLDSTHFADKADEYPEYAHIIKVVCYPSKTDSDTFYAKLYSSVEWYVFGDSAIEKFLEKLLINNFGGHASHWELASFNYYCSIAVFDVLTNKKFREILALKQKLALL